VTWRRIRESNKPAPATMWETGGSIDQEPAT
jgi:hypothetical protein